MKRYKRYVSPRSLFSRAFLLWIGLIAAIWAIFTWKAALITVVLEAIICLANYFLIVKPRRNKIIARLQRKGFHAN